jgi:hypothetical protein
MLLGGMILLTSQPVVKALGQGIAEGIGGSLVASGIAGMVLFLHVRWTDTIRSRLESFSRAGMVNIFPFRQVRIREHYDLRLANAREIDLVGHGLSSFREDYASEFVAWSHRARVRILLLDPDFPSADASYADQRDREEGRPPGKTRHDAELFEAAVNGLAELRRDQFEVRRMRAIPSLNMLRIDDEVFWGPYLVGLQSRNTPTMLVSRGGFLFDNLCKHFDNLWHDGFSIPSPGFPR